LQREDLLCLRMTNFSKLFVVFILGVLSSSAGAEDNDCKGCDAQKQESSHREQIKADRAKYDRENEKIIARPWDVIKDESPLPEKNK
jgi:hypothetical protein